MYQEQSVDLDLYFQQINEQQFNERYQNQSYIGHGATSKVYSRFDKLRNMYVAIKQYKSKQLKNIYVKKDIIREIQILQKTTQSGCDNFVKFYAAVKIITQNQRQKYCLIQQKCQCSLQEFLYQNRNKDLSQKQRIQLCIYVAKAVKQLHKISVLHRDLKPANFLMAYRNDKLIPVVVDFGHSRKFQQDVQLTTIRGSPKYINPHLFNSQQKYGYQWDNYSLGVIILQIMTLNFLYQIQQEEMQRLQKFQKRMILQLQRIQINLRQNKFSNLNLKIKNIIKKCLTDKKYKSNEAVEELIQALSQMNKNQQKSTSRSEQNSEPQLINYENQKINMKKIKNIKQLEIQKVVKSSQIKGQINRPAKINSDIVHMANPEQKRLGISPENGKKQIIIQQKQQTDGLTKRSKLIKQIGDIKFQLVFQAKRDQRVPQLISTYKQFNKKLDQNAIAIQQLENLKAFQSKFKQLQIIQTLDMQKKYKMKILIYCLLKLILGIKEKCNQKVDNTYSLRYTHKFLQTIIQMKRRLYKDLLDNYQSSLSTRQRQFIQRQNVSPDQIKQQYKNLLFNLDRPEIQRKIRYLID